MLLRSGQACETTRYPAGEDEKEALDFRFQSALRFQIGERGRQNHIAFWYTKARFGTWSSAQAVGGHE